jgi:hypothetical protein
MLKDELSGKEDSKGDG